MSPSFQLIFGIIITILLFLATGSFIVLLFAYINQKKKKHEEEKELMQIKFNEEMLKGKIDIQEHTFNYISSELHDNVAQLLVLLKTQLYMLEQDHVLNRPLLGSAKENLSNILSDLRGLAKNLSTDRIRNLDIEVLIKKEIEQINFLRSGTFEVHGDGSDRRLDERKKIILFRIVQECIQNCIKHAHASEVNAYIDYLPHQMIVSISDNGRGFDVEKTLATSDSLGLINLKTRAIETGGSCNIESLPGKGTTIKITIPYE